MQGTVYLTWAKGTDLIGQNKHAFALVQPTNGGRLNNPLPQKTPVADGYRVAQYAQGYLPNRSGVFWYWKPLFPGFCIV